MYCITSVRRSLGTLDMTLGEREGERERESGEGREREWRGEKEGEGGERDRGEREVWCKCYTQTLLSLSQHIYKALQVRTLCIMQLN